MHTLSVIIPIRNEAEAIPFVINGLREALQNLDYQIIIIDDGDDEAPEVIQRLHYNFVKYLRRPIDLRNGLAGAIIKGICLADGEYIATIDGDGQHPPEVIRRMHQKALSTSADMVMASRYINGGSCKGLNGDVRKFYSYFLRRLPQILFPKIKRATDPLAGCFLIKNSAIRLKKIRAIGFKISLEILIFSPIKHYEEISYEFRERTAGKSKANFKTGLFYFQQLVSLSYRYYLEDNLIKFRLIPEYQQVQEI